MPALSRFYLAFFLLLLAGSACQRNPEDFPDGPTNITQPTLATGFSDVRVTNARVSGWLAQKGNNPLTTFTLAWDTLPNPSPNLSTKIVWDNPDGLNTDTFSARIEGLLPGKTYYVRSYAHSYLYGWGVDGPQQSFTTLDHYDVLPGFPGGQVTDQGILYLNQKVYLVNGIFYHKEVYAFDPEAETWEKKRDFPGENLNAPASFSIDGTGYICSGSYYSFVPTKQFWAYNPAVDSFTRRADFPGPGRQSAVSFVIGGKAYVGMGVTTIKHRDMYAYDPATDTWSPPLDSFPVVGRQVPVYFTLGEKGYLGYGDHGAYDFWEFDPNRPTGQQWKELNAIPKPGLGAKGFSIGNTGYLLGGSNQLWKFEPAAALNGKWTRLQDFPDVVSFATIIGLERSAIIVGGRYNIVGGDPANYCWRFNLDE